MAQKKGENNNSKDTASQSTPSQTVATEDKKQATTEQPDALAKLEAELATQKRNEKRKTSRASDDKSTLEQPNSASVDSAQVVAATKSKSWLALFSLLLSLLALAAAGFIWWQNQLWLKNQEQVEQIKQQALVTTQQTLNQQQAQVTELLSQLAQQNRQQQNAEQSLAALQGRVSELGQSQPNYWLAAEANYLVNLAERRLLVEQDANTAMRLLVDANTRLAAMQDPSVFHIRTAISQDIAALKALVQPNTDDIYLSLSGLLAQAPDLPFAQVYIPTPSSQLPNAAQVNDSLNDWQDNLAISVKRFFAHFITIRKQEGNIQPQLPADQQWFVTANIRSQILMAQTAVLDNNQKRYVDALTTITTWSSQYFDPNQAQVVAFQNSIGHLLQQNIELNLPEQLKSQPLLANFVLEQLKLKQSPKAITEQAEESGND